MSIKRSLLRTIVKGLDFFWPKNRDVLLFGAHGTRYIWGNSKVMFDYINAIESKPFKCYFLTSNPPNESGYINRSSFSTIRKFLSAKTILLSHGLGDMGILRPSRRKNVIYLWHGQGPKADGYGSKKFTQSQLDKLDEEMRKATAFLTCSRFDSYIRAFGHTLHPKQILPTGYPRCDFLTSMEDRTSKIPSLLPDLPSYKKVILYAITWRNEGETKFFPFKDFDTKSLEQWCAEREVLILIRPHANDTVVLEQSKYIRYIPFDLLNDVMKILPDVDVLITDYSSIQTDFLLLNRPIIYIPYDLKKFRDDFGFWLPDYDFLAPGEKVSSFDELLHALDDGITGNDKYKEQRQRTNLLFNEYQTPGASDRVYDYLLRLVKKKSE
ncbi:MAG: CDP-glycerol glycerophosphotransferase family protein [Candidatus Thorarchaeota archaeon]